MAEIPPLSPLSYVLKAVERRTGYRVTRSRMQVTGAAPG